MRTISRDFFAATLALAFFGCGGTDNPSPPGELGQGGGSSSDTGGAASTGGSTSNSGSTGGASNATGGNSSATGGTSAATGGTSAATGGASNTGGAAPTGGRSQTGGAAPTGGSKATGGAATGGMAPTGGSKATGGAAPTGGSKATGGAATGGMAPTGGSKATGGMAATGGTTTTTTVTKFLGNITTGNSVNPSGLTYSKYWNQITPENQGKWGSVQSTPSSAFNWSSLDSIYSYANTNNVIFKQHTFVWGAQQPSGTPTLAQVTTWIQSFCQRYPNTKLIDVVNEPPPHTTPSYTSNLGAGESGTYPWITKAFKLARQYCGSAILILNDYNNMEYTDQRNHFVDIVKDIKANGAPIDAIGCQAHGLKGLSGATAQANLAYLNSQTSLPIYITEFDIDNSDDNGQLTSYQTHVPFFLNTSYIHGITVWGWIYGSTWEAGSGIVRGTSPRPAMTWLMAQVGRPNPPN